MEQAEYPEQIWLFKQDGRIADNWTLNPDNEMRYIREDMVALYSIRFTGEIPSRGTPESQGVEGAKLPRACKYCDRGEIHPDQFTFAPVPRWRIDGDRLGVVYEVVSRLFMIREMGCPRIGVTDNDAIVEYVDGVPVHCWPDSTQDSMYREYFRRRETWPWRTPDADTAG